MADKTFHSITLPGTDPARIPDMAAEFNTAISYAVRDYCTYQGILYRCITAHTGAWNASHFQATNLDNEFDDKLKIPPFQASAPANPRVGDLWIDNDEDSPILSIDPAPIAGSTNAVQSGGVRTLIDAVDVQKASRYLLTGDYSTSATYEKGQLVFWYPETFSSGHSYVVGESCVHNGVVYKCTTAHTGAWNLAHFEAQHNASTDTLYRCITDIKVPESWTAAHWQATNINTEINRLRESEADTDMIAENYGDSNSYAVGDYVVHNSDLFRCISAVSDTGSWDPDDWTQVKLANDVSDLNNALSHQIPELKSQMNGSVSAIANTTDSVSDEILQSINLSESGYYWNIETSVAVYTTISGTNYQASTAIPVTPGEIYTLTASVGQTHKARIWVATDDNLQIIGMADDFYTNSAITDTFIVPEGATKLLITTNSTFVPLSSVTLSKKNLYRVAKASDLEHLSNDIYKNVRDTNFNLTMKYFWNIETNVAVYTYLDSQWMASNIIPVEEGDIYIVTGNQGPTHKARIWAVTDDNLNIIAMANDHYTSAEELATETFIVPTGGTKLVLTTRHVNGPIFAWLYKRKSALDILDTPPFSGKKLSLLGDSISAYAGTIPTGNDAYYTGSNSGVSSPEQMWWKVLCEKTGMTPLVINGWSGSGITQLEDPAHVNKVPMSSDSRCAALNDGTNMPDVILIAGGVNDYTYAQSAQSEPLEWNAKTAPVLGNSFTEAYACMVKKLQTNYPNAIVVALSSWFTMRGTDNGYTLTHAVGQNVYTQQDYNDKIRFVAEQMHIPYIDVSNIGFNRNNFYPTYAIDSATIPTHPNAAGQAVMGKAIAEKLVELVKGFIT